MKNFAELGLTERTVNSLKKIGFETPTEVQEKTIGLILDGTDVIASAQTGTGKTAAYALPIIEYLAANQKYRPKVTALILVPTRELAIQVKDQIEKLSRGLKMRCCSLYGGTGYGAQISALRSGVEVVIATPGRLNDLIQRNLINLSAVRFCVLDEADRMVDMGFLPQVKKILGVCAEDRQMLMFTATLDERVRKIAADYMVRPVTVRCKENEVEPQSIDQHAHKVSKTDKDRLLLNVIEECGDGTVLVFTRTRRTAAKVTKRLRAANIEAEEIHSDISQAKREKTIKRYREGRFNVLVATDIAARGLDVPAITHVVNYDLPESAADYVHRIGRTGRAGRSGTAHSFISEDQRHLVRGIEKVVGRRLQPKPFFAPAPMPVAVAAL